MESRPGLEAAISVHRLSFAATLAAAALAVALPASAGTTPAPHASAAHVYRVGCAHRGGFGDSYQRT